MAGEGETMETERRIFAVSEINQYIKALLEGEPTLQEVYIRGEVSNYRISPPGHHYFTLKDAEGAIRCVLFRGNAGMLRFRPENGMKVIARGQISVFLRDGAYQLRCTALSPDGVGDLHVAFEQLKEKLWREGLFDPAHKKPLPPYPERIALITSGTGAAVHDMIRVIRRRWPLVTLVVLPVRVQGVEAPPEIVGAIRYANRWHVADLIITGRGGGSIEDLWAFNDERVARAIYDSEIPVISAVGHEPDVTIADFVADVRAATPSHAGEISVPDRGEQLERLQSLRAAMTKGERKRLELLGQRLRALAQKRALTDPAAFLQDKRLLLDYTQRNLAHAAAARLAAPRQSLGTLAASLDALSPLRVLGRGYAIVSGGDGTALRSVRETGAGEQVTVTLEDGRLRCTVDQTEEERIYDGEKKL